ncbi:tripartite tricarboxylate transporter TctB family protein [Azospirillum sp. SYSU D00513]|uniref:tripartite tricarboxylate transporter TctB family protein n=1 Tax=Azospirillum sp. SYSU D00513 TaxID=2812561 RepID=UPI001A979681|nr:tripartite tricarboxylate transporter TctB family protein [Azospirillum sp. SYSU D00513]
MSSTVAGPERGLSRRAVEATVAAFLILLALLALWDSYGRGAGWDNGPENGFFPARVAWLFLGASVLVLVNSVRQPDQLLVTWKQLGLVARVLGPLVAFVAMIDHLGIYVSSAVFIVLFMVVVGASRWWSILLTAAIVPVVCFLIFETQFGVPLPKGPVEALLGY